MTTEDRKQQWIRNKDARRARIIAHGGRQLNVLLEKEAAEALDALTEPNRTGERKSQLGVVSELLIKAAAKIKRPSARASARSK